MDLFQKYANRLFRDPSHSETMPIPTKASLWNSSHGMLFTSSGIFTSRDTTVPRVTISSMGTDGRVVTTVDKEREREKKEKIGELHRSTDKRGHPFHTILFSSTREILFSMR